MYIFITWLFFPSSFGTSQLRTETNLDSRWRIKFSLKCNFAFYKQRKIREVSHTFAWWARAAPALAELLSLGCWFLLSCSLWRRKPHLWPHCEQTTLQIYRCLCGQEQFSIINKALINFSQTKWSIDREPVNCNIIVYINMTIKVRSN